MEAIEIGQNYDKIAAWWEQNHKDSQYGVQYVRRAIHQVKNKYSALDVGCGSGGQIIDTILSAGFSLTALDVSQSMIQIAKCKHPTANFVNADFTTWTAETTFDLIVAWDSVFHAPRNLQHLVVQKLCSHLSPLGILIFTAGGISGDIIGEMDGIPFEYGSLSEPEYLNIIEASHCETITVEHDQPKHMVFICKRKDG